MANKKIIQLEETQNLDNFYIPGSKEVSGELESRKFNLGSIQSSIDEVKNFTTSEVEEFNSNTFYYSGQYISYNSKIYRFNTNHFPGEWNNSEVSEVTIYSEVSNLISNSGYETVHFNVSSSDGGLNNILNSIQVTLQLSNGNILQGTCDSEGNCSINIPIGLEYTIRMNDQLGYQSIGDITYKAEYKNRFVNLVYQKSLESETCNVNIVIKSDSPINNSFNGGTINLYKNDRIVGNYAISGNTASINGIKKGVSYDIAFQKSSSWDQITTSFIAPYSDSNIDIYFKYKVSTQYGLFLVYEKDNSYKEIRVNELFENGDTTNGMWLGNKFGITANTTKAFHIYTSGLAPYSTDFYIKFIKEVSNNNATKYGLLNDSVLVTQPMTPTLSNSITFPNVIGFTWTSTSNTISGLTDGRLSIPKYFSHSATDGKLSTNGLIIDTAANNVNSNIAQAALNKTFDYKINNDTTITLRGFVGSVHQYYQIVINYKTIFSRIYKELKQSQYARVLCGLLASNTPTPTVWTSSLLYYSSWRSIIYRINSSGNVLDSKWDANNSRSTTISGCRVLPLYSF